MNRSNPEVVQRHSSGLRFFFDSLPKSRPMQVLDLGGLNESNVNFLSSLECRVYALDLLNLFDRFQSRLPARQFEPDSAHAFVDEYLGFPPEYFDAILVWDVLEHFHPEVLDRTVSRLGQILVPGGHMLAFFHTHARGDLVPVQRYQIESCDTLHLRELQRRPLPSTFHTRGVERLFGDFSAVKFFLTRDHLREVIIVR